MVALIGIGGSELLLILGAALVLLGPKRLPEIARQLGKVSNQLRDANRDLKRELYANLEPPPAAARGDELQGGVPAPRPAARQIEQGAAAALPAAGARDSDYDAPYRDAEAEAKRALALTPASAPAPVEEPAAEPADDPARADADRPAPPTQKADPDESGSAS
jgi:sec-independent protein translocase protein TatB